MRFINLRFLRKIPASQKLGRCCVGKVFILLVLNLVMLIFFGYGSHFKKLLVRFEDLEVYQFYRIYHIFFIPLFWERKIGLFQDNLKWNFYEFDGELERILLNIPKNSEEKIYLKEIKKYEKEQHKKSIYFERHKEEFYQIENNDFVQFIKLVGIFLGIILLLFIINKMFF